MLKTIEAKFRSGQALTPNDRRHLVEIMSSTTDTFEFRSALYIYGTSFPYNKDVASLAEIFLKTPSPSLTATCLKVLVDFWGRWDEYGQYMVSYLDLNQYDEWGDETIVSVSFYLRKPQLQDEAIAAKLEKMREDASTMGFDEITELLDIYSN